MYPRIALVSNAIILIRCSCKRPMDPGQHESHAQALKNVHILVVVVVVTVVIVAFFVGITVDFMPLA